MSEFPVKPFCVICTISICALGFTSCLTKRTTTSGGRVVEENYVLKRPVKNMIEGLEVE